MIKHMTIVLVTKSKCLLKPAEVIMVDCSYKNTQGTLGRGPHGGEPDLFVPEPSLRLPGAHLPGPPLPGLAHSLCSGQRSALPCSQVLKQPRQGLRVPSTSRQALADAPSRDSLVGWSSLVTAHCDPMNSCPGKESGNQQLGGCPETPGAGSCLCILGQSEGRAAQPGRGPPQLCVSPRSPLPLCRGGGLLVFSQGLEDHP